MDFTAEELKMIREVFEAQLTGKPLPYTPALDRSRLQILRRVQNYLTETAYPATPALNRDATTNELWA